MKQQSHSNIKRNEEEKNRTILVQRVLSNKAVFFTIFRERKKWREREKKKHTSIRMYNIYELHEQQKKNNSQQTNDENKQMKH